MHGIVAVIGMGGVITRACANGVRGCQRALTDLLQNSEVLQQEGVTASATQRVWAVRGVVRRNVLTRESQQLVRI